MGSALPCCRSREQSTCRQSPVLLLSDVCEALTTTLGSTLGGWAVCGWRTFGPLHTAGSDSPFGHRSGKCTSWARVPKVPSVADADAYNKCCIIRFPACMFNVRQTFADWANATNQADATAGRPRVSLPGVICVCVRLLVKLLVSIAFWAASIRCMSGVNIYLRLMLLRIRAEVSTYVKTLTWMMTIYLILISLNTKISNKMCFRVY